MCKEVCWRILQDCFRLGDGLTGRARVDPVAVRGNNHLHNEKPEKCTAEDYQQVNTKVSNLKRKERSITNGFQ